MENRGICGDSEEFGWLRGISSGEFIKLKKDIEISGDLWGVRDIGGLRRKEVQLQKIACWCEISDEMHAAKSFNMLELFIICNYWICNYLKVSFRMEMKLYGIVFHVIAEKEYALTYSWILFNSPSISPLIFSTPTAISLIHLIPFNSFQALIYPPLISFRSLK